MLETKENCMDGPQNVENHTIYDDAYLWPTLFYIMTIIPGYFVLIFKTYSYCINKQNNKGMLLKPNQSFWFGWGIGLGIISSIERYQKTYRIQNKSRSDFCKSSIFRQYLIVSEPNPVVQYHESINMVKKWLAFRMMFGNSEYLYKKFFKKTIMSIFSELRVE